MPITVDISDRDLRDYLEAYTWLRWHSWLWPALSVVVVIVWVATAWNHGEYAVFAGVYSVFVVVIYVWELFSISSRMKRANEKRGKVTYTFTAAGFEYQSSVSHSETSWDAIDRAVETRRSFLLIYGTSVFVIIPKRFVPEESLAALRALLKMN